MTDRKKCPHGRRKYICRECKGSSLCEHDAQRHYCKKCHALGRKTHICEHGLHRQQCRRCNGNQFCEHRKMRIQCSICRPDYVYRSYMRHEKTKTGGLSPNFMSLTLFCRLVKRNCIWCGKTPEQANGMGVDRRDNAKGHITGNLDPCCGECNMRRRNSTHTEFKDWIRRVFVCLDGN